MSQDSPSRFCRTMLLGIVALAVGVAGPAPETTAGGGLAAGSLREWPTPLWLVDRGGSGLHAEVASELPRPHVLRAGSVRFWDDDDYLSPTATYMLAHVTAGGKVSSVRSFSGPGNLTIDSGSGLALWYAAPQGLGEHGRLEAFDADGAKLWVRDVRGGVQAVSPAGSVVHISGCQDLAGRCPRGGGIVLSCTGEVISEFSGCSHLPPVWDTDGSRFYFISPGGGTGRDSLRCRARDGRVLWSRHIGTEGAMLSGGCPTLSAGKGVVAVVSLDFPPRGEPISSAQRVLAVYDASGESLFSVNGPSDRGPVSCAVSADGQRVIAILPEEPLKRNLARWIVRTYSTTSHVPLSECLFPPLGDSPERVRIAGLAVSPEGRTVAVCGHAAAEYGAWLVAALTESDASILRGSGKSTPKCRWTTEGALIVESGDTAGLYKL